MRRSVVTAVLAALVLGLTGLAPIPQALPDPVVAAAAETTATPSAPEFTPAPVAWTPCTSPGLQSAGADCGFVEVPLGYADPAGPTVRLAVSRVRHTTPEPQYQGVLLVNPGGPGGSGIALSQLGSLVPDGAGAGYDWIGFDPRGVGASEPSLSCIPDHASYNRPEFVPTTSEIEQAQLDRARSYAEACARTGGALLDHMTSLDTVRDMESIRKALGVEQINYYGFSYGTYLGQVYATVYPDRVRRMVLDGVVDVRGVWYQANLDQDVAFQKNIEIFFDWVAKNDALYGLGTSGEDVEKRYYAERDELRAAPAGGLIGSSEWTDLFLSAGYDVRSWEGVASAFSRWVASGDAAGLKAAYDANASVDDDNGYAVYLAVECTDARWPAGWEQWRADNTRVHQIAPFETWANAWFNAPCFFWPVQAGEPVEVDGSGVPGALLISESLDGATPFEGALQARRLFPNSALVEGVGGTSHSTSLSGVECVDSRVADYLATGALPVRVPGDRSDAQCEPLPQPAPTELAPTPPPA